MPHDGRGIVQQTAGAIRPRCEIVVRHWGSARWSRRNAARHPTPRSKRFCTGNNDHRHQVLRPFYNETVGRSAAWPAASCGASPLAYWFEARPARLAETDKRLRLHVVKQHERVGDDGTSAVFAATIGYHGSPGTGLPFGRCIGCAKFAPISGAE